jgi:hypothetical protein
MPKRELAESALKPKLVVEGSANAVRHSLKKAAFSTFPG